MINVVIFHEVFSFENFHEIHESSVKFMKVS